MTMEGISSTIVATRPAALREAYSLFARVLDYPGDSFSREVEELMAQLTSLSPEAVDSLKKFELEFKGINLGELRELYTDTFDMRPDRTTNLGCHLFGEDVRRNLFMAQLKERMKAREIPLGCELPDHLSLVLRLLAAEESEEEAQTLTEDCLKPAVTRILSTFGDGGSGNPYAHALRALSAVLDKDGVAIASSGSRDLNGV